MQTLTTEQLAERWQMQPKTLEKWRMRGRGPAFVKLEREVRYKIEDIEAYEQKRTRRRTDD